jgi:isocitrate dehydrogenase
VRVFDAAVRAAYGDRRRIEWREVLAGEKAFKKTGSWLPEETLAAFRQYLVGIKGPLTTPVGGGIRSLNVALRQELDLYVCLRPVRYFHGMETPVKRPDLVNMVIFRENTEDIYAGIEFQDGTPEADEFRRVFAASFPKLFKKIPVPADLRHRHQADLARGQRTADPRRARLRPGQRPQEPHVGAQGQHHEVHRGRVPRLGLRTGASASTAPVEFDGGPVVPLPGGLVSRTSSPTPFLQQILTRPAEYDVIATPNLNGDYISDALARQVGGIGIAPGGNINYMTGHAVFEAPHGTAPEVRQPRQGQPRLGHPLRRDDAAIHGLDGGRRLRHRVAGEGDRFQAGDVRSGATHRRFDRVEDVRVRRRHDSEHVAGGLQPAVVDVAGGL